MCSNYRMFSRISHNISKFAYMRKTYLEEIWQGDLTGRFDMEVWQADLPYYRRDKTLSNSDLSLVSDLSFLSSSNLRNVLEKFTNLKTKTLFTFIKMNSFAGDNPGSNYFRFLGWRLNSLRPNSWMSTAEILWIIWKKSAEYLVGLSRPDSGTLWVQ